MRIRRDSYNTWDCIFLFWFLTNALFNHSILGTAGQGVFMLYSCIRCFLTHKIGTSNILYFYVLFVFICYMNIQFGNSIVPAESSQLLNVLLRNGLFLYSMFAYIRQMSVAKLTKILSISCVISSVAMMVYNSILTGSIVIRDAEDGLNGNMLATLNAMAICSIFALDNWKSSKNLLFISVLILFSILAGTRKAFIVLIFGFSTYILFSNPSKIFSNIAKLSLFGCLVFFLLMKVPLFYEIIGNRFETLFSFIQGGDTDGSVDSRSKYLEIGFAYFLLEPWTGYGINCYKELPMVSTYSHNNYIELLFSVGIPGLIAFYLMHLYILKKAISNWKKRNYKSNVLALSLILSAMVAEYAMVVYYERLALFYYVLILRYAVEGSKEK